MTAADPAAVWVMQGWLFVSSPDFWQPAQVKAYLGSVPNDRMVILDLMSEISPVWSKTANYYGKLWIWNVHTACSHCTLGAPCSVRLLTLCLTLWASPLLLFCVVCRCCTTSVATTA